MDHKKEFYLTLIVRGMLRPSATQWQDRGMYEPSNIAATLARDAGVAAPLPPAEHNAAVRAVSLEAEHRAEAAAERKKRGEGVCTASSMATTQTRRPSTLSEWFAALVTSPWGLWPSIDDPVVPSVRLGLLNMVVALSALALSRSVTAGRLACVAASSALLGVGSYMWQSRVHRQCAAKPYSTSHVNMHYVGPGDGTGHLHAFEGRAIGDPPRMDEFESEPRPKSGPVARIQAQQETGWNSAMTQMLREGPVAAKDAHRERQIAAVMQPRSSTAAQPSDFAIEEAQEREGTVSPMGDPGEGFDDDGQLLT